MAQGEATRFRTGGEQAEISRKGGKASGEARRRKATMKSLTAAMMEAPAPEAVIDELVDVGFDREDVTYSLGIAWAMVKKALSGDVKAATFIRDLLGEDPAMEIRRAELRIRREELKLKKRKRHEKRKRATPLTIRLRKRSLRRTGCGETMTDAKG